ncbi:hypothetical protein AB1Y20_013611 [Prymnesium parvum]|uniref:non-specific serine/threonine protein kinase n=1 Tax=Prymnesium parvum TaxID=97485 RepID=A0AB34IJ52_PRYPA
MGCSPSRPRARTHSSVTPAANVPLPVAQLGPSPAAAAKAAYEHGAAVLFGGEAYTVQYRTAAGRLDLRAADGTVQYGVSPRDVTPAAAAPGGEEGEGREGKEGKEGEVGKEEGEQRGGGDGVGAGGEGEGGGVALRLIGAPLATSGGSGALVYRCVLEDGAAGGGELAVKLLEVARARASSLEALASEVSICARLHHPTVVRFLHAATAVRVPPPHGGVHMAIVMELLPVSLESLIAGDHRSACEPKRHFSAPRCCAIVRDLIDALAYLHSLSPPLIHRDLKPANVFFEATAREDDRIESAAPARLRLGDFDTSVFAEEPLVEFTGTPAIQPPEMFAQQEHHTPADVWALGVVIGWMLSLRDPMGELTMSEWEEAISSTPPRLAAFTTDFDGTPLAPIAGVARQCCALRPEDRPSAKTLLQLPMFQNPALSES